MFCFDRNFVLLALFEALLRCVPTSQLQQSSRSLFLNDPDQPHMLHIYTYTYTSHDHHVSLARIAHFRHREAVGNILAVTVRRSWACTVTVTKLCLQNFKFK
jgi:hypothetical protein